MTPTDYVTGNRGQSRGFRLDRNWTLQSDQGLDIYICIFILISFIRSIIFQDKWEKGMCARHGSVIGKH